MSWHKSSSKDRGYGIEWQRKREEALRRDKGLCMVCLGKGHLTLATEVDHIVGRAEGKRKKVPPAQLESLLNLQSICKECHAAKTAREAGGVARPVTGPDGWPILK